MNRIRELARRFLILLRCSQFNADLDEEMRLHRELREQEQIERGLSPKEARYAAQRRFGNDLVLREESRDMWGWNWLDNLVQDIRFGLRMLAKDPGFAAVAILTLALGIGGNTALFSIVNGVLLNPLPYPDPGQLVTLHASKPNFEYGSISYPNFRDWQRNNHVFSYIAIHRDRDLTLTSAGEAERVQGQYISSDFFRLLGVNAVIGRAFTQGEDEIAAAPLALISEGLWKRKFGFSQEVLGKTLILDGRSFTIVGVISNRFRLSLPDFGPGDVYLPFGQWANPSLTNRAAGLAIHGIARLKPGVSIEQARADMQQVTRNLEAAYPDVNKGVGASMVPLKDSIIGNIRPRLFILWGAVGLVLLIACVNVANLLLARATGRSRELTIRVALGASHARLARQLLTESVLLSAAGGGLGLLLAAWGTKAAISVLPAGLPRAEEIGLDARLLLFTLLLSLVTGILFGLAPTYKGFAGEFHDTLKRAGRGLSGGSHRLQGAFVVVEMAMAMVLLIGAGLMLRSLFALWSVDPGFNPRNVLTFSVSVPPSRRVASPAATRAYLRALHQTFESAPGVHAVSLSWAAIPMASEDDNLFWLENEPRPSSRTEKHGTLSYVVEPGYLQAMGIPLQKGRFFSPRDDENSPLVVVIDDIFARKYFPNEDPVGKRLYLDNEDGARAEIIGVVGHVKQWGLDSDDAHSLRAELYSPYMQLPDSGIALAPAGTTVVAQYEGTVSAAMSSIRQASRQMSGDQLVYGFQTMEEIISDTLSARRSLMILLGIFAALALALSNVGIYAVVAYLVGQRTHEIGIRMALGAKQRDVLGTVLGYGVKMALLGDALGLAAALGLTRLLVKISMLFKVSATDPVTFAGVAALLTLVALAATYVPARRATKIDPMVALRHE